MHKTFFSFCIAVFSCMHAIHPDTHLSITGGYRQDRFESFCSFHDKAGAIAHDQISAKKLHIWQVGYDLQVKLPNLWVDQMCYNLWWMDQFYIRSQANWGRGAQGFYHERVTNDLLSLVESINGTTNELRSFNYDVGLGWLYPINECFGMGPVAGFAYDKVRYKAYKSKADSSSTYVGSVLASSHSKFSTAFQGPWIGIDAALNLRPYTMNAGYEYHYITKWRGSFKLLERFKSHPSDYTSDKRRASSGCGHVGFLAAHYNFASTWQVGLKGKYSYYKTNDADCFLEGSSIHYEKVKADKNNLHSFTIVADFGYLF